MSSMRFISPFVLLMIVMIIASVILFSIGLYKSQERLEQSIEISLFSSEGDNLTLRFYNGGPANLDVTANEFSGILTNGEMIAPTSFHALFYDSREQSIGEQTVIFISISFGIDLDQLQEIRYTETDGSTILVL